MVGKNMSLDQISEPTQQFTHMGIAVTIASSSPTCSTVNERTVNEKRLPKLVRLPTRVPLSRKDKKGPYKRLGIPF